MVASSVFITNCRGKPLISRNYRGSVNKSTVTTEFQRLLIENEDEYIYSSPIIIDKGITYCFIKYNDVYILGVTKANCNVMLMLNFLYKIISIFEHYFDGLDEEVIRDNFVLIYELLDEICDFGYPQHTEYKLLKDYIVVSDVIKTDYHKETKLNNTKKALETITGTNTRRDDIKYKQNEVFLDVVENVNLSMASNGNIIHSEVLGTIKMNTRLSGVPQLKLGLNDKIMMQRTSKRRRHSRKRTVQLDGIKFHECVQLHRYEADRSISFVPPDGEFELMQYRLDIETQRPLICVECRKDMKSKTRVEYLVKVKSQFKRRSTANNVEVFVPIPTDADTPIFKTSIGCVEYEAEYNWMKWNIKQLNGEKEYIMKAHFGLPSVDNDVNVEKEQAAKPIEVKFDIPYFTVSGIQVRYLKIIEKSGYKALPWVRYITQNGNYSIKM